ncbi:hypothetical protein K490DRAFT_17981, partial [Saccharata proteae CBS 121410]
SRSPSPAQPPPLAESPGPRATALQNVFANALDATVKRCSYSSFAACFPTPAQYVAQGMDMLWRDFTTRIRTAAKAEFDNVLASRSVIPSLNSLDVLIADAKKRKERAESEANGGPVEPPTPPHTLPPEALTIAHLMPFLSNHKTALESQLSETQAANSTLRDEILAQRAEINALVQGLEEVVGDIERSVPLLTQDDVEVLPDEVLKIEDEL